MRRRQERDAHAERSRARAIAAWHDPARFLDGDEVVPMSVASDERFRAAFTRAHRAISANGPLGAIEEVVSRR